MINLPELLTACQSMPMFDFARAAASLPRSPHFAFIEAVRRGELGFMAMFDIPRLGFGRIITLANSLQPNDGLNHLERLFREHSKNKNRRQGQNSQRDQDGAETGSQQDHAKPERHLMPEKWRTWPPRGGQRDLMPPDGLSEPSSDPVGE